MLDGRCRAANETYTVYALNNDFDHSRLGLVVGKKAARKSVDRNRIKRTIRETFRNQAATYQKLDLVVIAKAAAADKTKSHLKNQLTTLLDRVEKKCANFSSD